MTITTKIIASGIVATALMSVMLFIAPYLGLPKVNIPAILASMTNTSVLISSSL